MTQYETAFLISPNLEEEETEKVITQMAEVISKKKGKMINEDRWGKRKLAYPIKKFEEAFYVFFHYEGDPEIPSELERRFKQTEAVLRYLTVKKTQKENVRRKKKVPAEKEDVPPRKEGPETGVTETEKTQAEEKKEVFDAEEAGEKKEAAQKREAVEKEEGNAEERGAERKGDLEKDEAPEKKKDSQEDVAPPKKGKEK
ncbi:MAG: 30S ribosomal protein S6 [Candidatus Aminicenantes bacterium]|jgi:small subunit ribosomal protein S6